ncbi:MAG: Adenylate and Guanylate cyclase catalytic protein [Mucilaginibacter sp.]|nr:Adenylate and Guanylate cyclase catalytic protein [Mucilaginibacter sp.]
MENDVSDVVKTTFDYTLTKNVPSTNDTGLSYERGISKKGKILNTCVLFVDIRNSVALTATHKPDTMGRIYTAFTKAVIKIARHHNGHTRNIIGDRVMVVFPEQYCFTNAVECAISINHIASQIINKQFASVDFKCGIGIHYGELKIIKVGIQRNGTESAENKGLVWTGEPANIASRLTDFGNKSITTNYYDVTYNPINLAAFFGRLPNMPGFPPPAKQPMYSIQPITKRFTAEEFADKIVSYSTGTIDFSGGKFISFEKKPEMFTYKPILITEEVLNGLKAERKRADLYTSGFWTEQKGDFKNVNSKVYGNGSFWKI